MAKTTPMPVLFSAALAWAFVASGFVAAVPPRSPWHTPQRALVVSRCDSLRWGAATGLVNGDGRRIYVQAPLSPVHVRGGVAFIGIPAYMWATREQFGVPGGPQPAPEILPAGAVLLTQGGIQSIPMPAGVHAMVHVRAFQWKGDTADVVWGEVESGEDSRRTAFVQSLWHARFDGTRWTTPDLLFRATAIHWEPIATPTSSVGDDVYVVATGIDSVSRPQWSGIVTLQRRNGRWIARRAMVPGFPPQEMTLATRAPNELLVVFADELDARLAASMHATRAFFARQSVDGGATWTSARLIQLLHGTDGSWPQATQVAGQITHLFWSTYPLNDTLPHISEIDSDDWHTWTNLVTVPIDGRPAGFHVVAVDSLRSLAVVQTRPDGRMWSLIFDGARLPRPVAVPGPSASAIASLSRIGADTALLVWGTGFSKAPIGASQVVWLGPACN